MTKAPPRPPAAVARGKALAARLHQRTALFKARNYMGPVHIEVARCTYRWFTLTLLTRPWAVGAQPRVLEWQVRPSAVALTPVGIELLLVDTTGFLVDEPNAIAQIEALRQSGASVEQLLRAFNDASFSATGVAPY